MPLYKSIHKDIKNYKKCVFIIQCYLSMVTSCKYD